MKKLVEKIIRDVRYLKNVEHGKPRFGHPEGKVKYHIIELEKNLEKLSSRGVSEEDYWKLKFLIHIHDTFKAEAVPNSPILSLNSHASLAKAYASQFIDDVDLLNMIQFHDENYALWKEFAKAGTYNNERFQSLLQTIKDWNLFLMFLIIDGSTQGKDKSKLAWFVNEVRKYKETTVDESWILSIRTSEFDDDKK